MRHGTADILRGNLRLVDELLAHVRRAGASGEILIRDDSGFENKALYEKLDRQCSMLSIGIKQHRHIAAAIEEIPEGRWQALCDYAESGEAQIAGTKLGKRRPILRRVRTLSEQGPHIATGQQLAFLTNRTEALGLAEVEHRKHAVVELAIRDLKVQALAYHPSGSFAANMAWTVIACLAHNLGRWAEMIGLGSSSPCTAGRGGVGSSLSRADRPARRGTSRCICRLAGPGGSASSRRSAASGRSRP
ncbi:MAG TPA: transposase [Solirubrobacteraceae bacterium]|nr:transposase [Solirubrobacteraceae bacterium]